MEKEKLRQILSANNFFPSQRIIDDLYKVINYLDLNYKRVSKDKIVDGEFLKVFSHQKDLSLGEIYLNRIINNVKKIIIDKNTNVKGAYEHSSKAITFNPDRINNQARHWNISNIFNPEIRELLKDEGALEQFKKNLADKIIIHEFNHAAGDDKSIDLVYSQHNGGFFSHSKASTYCSRLEELMAEKLALDATGQKICYFETYKNQSICGYNPESSNFAISSLIEFIPKALGEKDFVENYFINPTAYLEKLNQKFKNAFPGQNSKSFSTYLNDSLIDIADNNNAEKLIELQTFFLKIYKERLKLNFKQGLGFDIKLFKQSTEDYMMFVNLLAYQFDAKTGKVILGKNCDELKEIYKLQLELYKKYQPYLSNNLKDYRDFKSQVKSKYINAIKKSLSINEEAERS